MTTTTSRSTCERGSLACTDDALPAVVEQHRRSSCSCCSCPTCCSGRTIRWQQGVSLSGIAFDVALLAIALFKVSSVWPYVITAGGSAALHGFATIALYVWQPRRALEKDIEMAGDVQRKVGDEAADIQSEVDRLQKLLQQQKGQLEEEKVFTEKFKQAADEKIAEIEVLTQKLNGSQRELEEVRKVSDSWKSCAKQFREIIGKINANRISEDVDWLTNEIERFRGSQSTLQQEVNELAHQTEGVQKVQKYYGKMLDDVKKAFEGLTTDLSSKKTLLVRAEQEIGKMEKQVAELKAVKIGFMQLQEKSTAIAKQLEDANETLRKYEPILQSPQFAEALKKYTSTSGAT